MFRLEAANSSMLKGGYISFVGLMVSLDVILSDFLSTGPQIGMPISLILRVIGSTSTIYFWHEVNYPLTPNTNKIVLMFLSPPSPLLGNLSQSSDAFIEFFELNKIS